MPKGKVACGRFLKPFGVGGELKFEPYFPEDINPASLASAVVRHKPGKARADLEILIASARPLSGGLWAIRPDGCGSPEEAAEFTNAELMVDCALMPKLGDGEYLAEDIIGCRVVDAQGTLIGAVRDVYSTGANDIWELKGVDGRELLVPAIAHVIVSVDLESRTITINVLEGLFD